VWERRVTLSPSGSWAIGPIRTARELRELNGPTNGLPPTNLTRLWREGKVVGCGFPALSYSDLSMQVALSVTAPYGLTDAHSLSRKETKLMMNERTGASFELRIMAMELVLADALATIYRSTSDPQLSLEIKRRKFGWLFEENRNDIAYSVLNLGDPNELRIAVDQLLLMSKALIQKRGIA
jgi:hypothetical protein